MSYNKYDRLVSSLEEIGEDVGGPSYGIEYGGYGYYNPNKRRVYVWLTCKGDAYRTGEAVEVTSVYPSHKDAEPNDVFVGTVIRYTGETFIRG